MNIVIAGGGKVGYYLAKTLLSYKHTIMVIEQQKVLCEKIADDLNISVLTGDATDVDVLSTAITDQTSIFVAVTGQDEENLIACQLAKNNFGVKKTIARVNNPKNIKVFEKLGVDTAVSSTSIIAELIEQEIDYQGMLTLRMIKDDRIIFNEIEIFNTSPVKNKKLEDLEIPKGCVVVSIFRDNQVIIPNGSTTFYTGDFVVAVSTREKKKALRDLFFGR